MTYVCDGGSTFSELVDADDNVLAHHTSTQNDANINNASNWIVPFAGVFTLTSDTLCNIRTYYTADNTVVSTCDAVYGYANFITGEHECYSRVTIRKLK